MNHIGKSLGFEGEFCDNAIRNVLENEYIVDTVPKFSTKELAVKFIKDGLAIAFSNNELYSSEEEWLRATAEKNGLDENWLYLQRNNIINGEQLHPNMEVDDIIV